MERTERSIEIKAPIEVVFDLYSDFERFPEWMEHIKEVRQTEPRFTRWAADAPLGIDVEWEAETTELEPNRKIAWRTVRGDIEMEGEVTFEEAGQGTTLVHLAISYQPPAGHLGAMVAKLLGNDPEKQIDEDLLRFAKIAEGYGKKRGKTPGRRAKARSSLRKAAAGPQK